MCLNLLKGCFLLMFLFFSNSLISKELFTVDSIYLKKYDIVYLDPDYEGYNGFPLGNGDLGGMLWCTENGIKIQINKIDLYDKPSSAQMTLRSGGQISIDFGVPCYDYMFVSDFEERLSLHDALCTVFGETDFSKTKIKSWVDVNHNVWIVECDVTFKNNCSNGSNVDISLERWGSRVFGGWYNSIDSNMAESLRCTNSFIRDNTLILNDIFEGGLNFSIACRLLNGESSEFNVVNNHKLSINQKINTSRKFYLLISVATSEEAENPSKKVIEQLDMVENNGVNNSLKEHIKWWHSFWDRSFVFIDDDYVENIYYLRRYLVASSSRGKYPVPFNGGLWTWNHDHRQWRSPVHWNNQQSYWGLAEQNDPDLMKPFIDTYFRLIPKAEEYTLKKYNINNAISWAEVHDYAGNMYYTDREDMKYNFTPASQIASIFWNYYEFTQNYQCLEDTIYPFIKKTAEFYLQKLEWDSIKSQYYLYPAQPYEHPYTCNLKNPITDRYMIESLFKQCIKSAKILKKDEDKVEKWSHVINHLWEPPVLNVPGKGEVFVMAYKPNGDVYPDLETYSKRQFYHFDAHTTMVFPANLLGLDNKNSRFFSIAKNVALHHPLDRNAITPGAIVSARLGLGEKVMERLHNMINHLQHFNQGLFYNIDHWFLLSKYRNIENSSLITQRDYVFDSRCYYNGSAGNSGLWAKPFIQCGMEPINIIGTAINEMLLQSHEDKIRIFPVKLSNKSMAFKLRARGAFIVSSFLDKNGIIPSVHVKSLEGNKCLIQNPWDDCELIITNTKDELVPFEINSDDVIVFLTEKGENYTIKKLAIQYDREIVFSSHPNMRPKVYGEATLGKKCTYKRSVDFNK